MKIGTKIEINNGIINFGGAASGTAGYGIRDNAGTLQIKSSGGSWQNFSAGTSGTSGVVGVAGTSGTSGSSGTSGTSRTSGTSGATGAAGTSGTSGPAGDAGASGTSGTNGIYTGSSATYTSFPIGSYVTVVGGPYGNNDGRTLYVNSNYYAYSVSNTGNGTLDGTWRCRGQWNYDEGGGEINIYQRVS